MQQTDSQPLVSLQLALQNWECKILSGFQELITVGVLLISYISVQQLDPDETVESLNIIYFVL